MSFEITGIVQKIYDTENKTDSFRAREFVIRTEENYPQFVKFQLVQDRCELIDSCKEDDKIKVFFDLRGREWNGKYFTNLNAWKIEKMNEEALSQEGETNQTPFNDSSDFPSEEPKNLAEEKDFDDLPF